MATFDMSRRSDGAEVEGLAYVTLDEDADEAVHVCVGVGGDRVVDRGVHDLRVQPGFRRVGQQLVTDVLHLGLDRLG
jgi:hypothetical protein